MERQLKVFQAIKDECDRIDANVQLEHIYVKDRRTEEFIPVLAVLNEQAQFVLQKIRKAIRYKPDYVTAYQESFTDMAKELTGSEAKVLFYLIGKMTYNNLVKGITMRGLSKGIGIGINTAKDAIDGLTQKNFVMITGKNIRRTYHVNPSIVWKGSIYKKKQKVDMFFDNNIKDAVAAYNEK
jgi:hypothetical protein